jgi:hypothetical protein
MKPPVVRVVYDNLPYLIVPGEDGSLDRAYGPFTPGTEPSLAEAGHHNEVRDPDTLHALSKLIPISPTVPPARDTLSGQG